MTRPALRLVQNLVDEDTGELVGCPHCQESRDECEVWEKRVLELERKVKRLEADRDEKARSDKRYMEAESLFEEWKRECGHPNASFDDTNRINLALRAVRRYPRDKLSWVIQYGKHFAYVDEKGVKHDRFGLLFQDAEHIEKYANGYARRRRELEGSK